MHIPQSTLYRWIGRYNRKGLDGVVFKGGSGRPRKISIAKFQAEYVSLILEPQLAGEDNFTAVKFHKCLTQECRESLCYQTLLNYMHERSLSLVAPRPSVVDKQNEDDRREFLLKIHQLYQAGTEIWYADEVGFEGDPRPRSKWVKVGSKPVAGRASEHLRFSAIGAVNLNTGEFFSLAVPGVDSIVFQTYLDELSKVTNNRKITLALDNAAWHKTATLNWHNFTPLYLPEYSPDLNPIENLWRYIKINYFNGWYAKNIEQLVEKVCHSLHQIGSNTTQIRSTTNFKNLLRQHKHKLIPFPKKQNYYLNKFSSFLGFAISNWLNGELAEWCHPV
ncbi:MAG TPA: IS630 family transposase [Oligoflexia bacterium]|nr:IS630 family transposase [Oligoflexia bacterium]HMP27179.1 IS630 family transposase [Oligoflexia bacterium]